MKNALNAKRERKKHVRCIHLAIIVIIGAVDSVLPLPLLLDVDNEVYPLSVVPSVMAEGDHAHLHLAAPTHPQDPLHYAVAEPLHVVRHLSLALLLTLTGIAYLVRLVRHRAGTLVVAVHTDGQLILRSPRLPTRPLLHALLARHLKRARNLLYAPSPARP